MARFASGALGAFDPLSDSPVRGMVERVARRNAAQLAAIAEEARAAADERRSRINALGHQSLKRGRRR